MLVSGSIQIRLLTTFGMVSWPAIRALMTAQDACHGFWCQEDMQFPLKLHQGQEAIGQFMQTDVRRIAFFVPTRVLSHLIAGRACIHACVFSCGRISRISSEFRP